MQVRGAAVVAGAALLIAGSSARAGGFETVENGTVANGRAGAFVARADDPTAVMLNVAGIGTGAPEGHPLQLYVGANLTFSNTCFARAGAYDGARDMPYIDRGGRDSPNGYSATVFTQSYAGAAYPKVCNDAAPFVAPNLMATYAISRRFGIGVGIYGPNSVGQAHYADTVTATTASGMSVSAPGPARYVLVGENLLLVHLSLGASYEVVPGMLRIGAAIEPSVGRLSFDTVANVQGTQSPGADLLTSVAATGFFISGSLGALFTPASFLQLGVNAHLTSNLNASGSGTADAFHYAASASDHRTSSFDLDSMSVALPHQVRLGARFVIPRAGGQRLNDPSPARAYNAMRDEVADIEIDGIWEHASAFSSLDLKFATGANGQVCVGAGPMGGCALRSPLPPVSIPHNWTDVYGVRLGADWNVLPDQLAVRAGAAFETGSAPAQFQNLDLPGQQVFSVHAGLTYRINHRFSINAAYAHQFVSTVDNTGVLAAPGTTVTDANAGLRTIGTTGLVGNSQCNDNNAGAGGGACTNNRGVFTSSLDVVSLGANLAF